MSKDGRIWLSHSGIETLQRCPRCFWLVYNKGIYQPEGIVSRLANRFDTVLKNYFNIYRPTGELPPLVEGKIFGKLENPFQEKYFTQINDRYGFWGKLDECLINENGEYVPVDFKTSSSDPRGRETLRAYQTQINDYLFLISQNHKKAAKYGYLIFVYPDDGKELHKGFQCIIHVVKVEGDIENTKMRISEAISVIEGKMPDPKKECPFCNWYDSIKSEIGDIQTKVKPKKKSAQIFFQDKLI